MQDSCQEHVFQLATVDSVQGREYEVALLLLTREPVGEEVEEGCLGEPHRLNVALSRSTGPSSSATRTRSKRRQPSPSGRPPSSSPRKRYSSSPTSPLPIDVLPSSPSSPLPSVFPVLCLLFYCFSLPLRFFFGIVLSAPSPRVCNCSHFVEIRFHSAVSPMCQLCAVCPPCPRGFVSSVVPQVPLISKINQLRVLLHLRRAHPRPLRVHLRLLQLSPRMCFVEE